MLLKNRIAIALSTIIYCSPAMSAEIWDKPIPERQKDLEIAGGSVIKETSGGPLTGINAGQPGDHYTVVENANGAGISIILKSTAKGNSVNVIGVTASTKDSSVTLGNGVNIDIEVNRQGGGNPMGSSAQVYGIWASGGGSVTGKNVNINLHPCLDAAGCSTPFWNMTGIQINAGNKPDSSSKVSLGGDNKIIIRGRSLAAVSLLGAMDNEKNKQYAEFEADNLIIDTKSDGGLNAGIDAQSNSKVTLTGATKIYSEGAALAAKGDNSSEKDGGVIEVEKVTIETTSKSRDGAVFAQGGGSVKIGAGSSVKTDDMHGLYATSYLGFTQANPQRTTIMYEGAEGNRNTVNVLGQTGVTAVNKGVITLTYVDITATAQNSNVIGIRSMNGGTINAENVTVTVKDGVNDNQSIAAVLSKGKGSQISFSGESKIDASGSANKIALSAEDNGGGGKITVKDKAEIIGNLSSSGQGSSIELNLSKGSILEGSTTVQDGGIINMQFNEGSRWVMTEDESSLTSVTLGEGSALYLQSPINRGDYDTFKPVARTITGNFIGGGTIYFNTVLGDDESATDHLTIKGDVEGQSLVVVKNIGGKGAKTTEGITLITVNGTAQEGGQAFQQSGRIGAGAYEYQLVSNGANTQWYLTSALCGDDCPEPPEGSNPETPGGSNPPEGSNPETPGGSNPPEGSNPETPGGANPPVIPSPEKNRLRAEAGSYLNNQMIANNLFVMNLADREMGEFAYLEGSNEQNNLHQLWIRMAGGHLKFRDQSQQLTTTSDYYALQFGGLLQEWVNDRKNHYRLGLMGSIGNAYGTTNGKYHTKGGVNRSQSHLTGQSIGIYFTYYADEESRQGAYLDTWVQHNWFQNSVEPDGKPTEKYNSRGFTASLESGFSLRLNELTEAFPYQWYMQPHIQLTYMGVRMKGHREVNGTYVRSANDDNAQVKLGVRFALSPYATAQPYDIKGFADLSWISNSKDFGVSLDQTVVESKGAKNIGELKVGVEGTVNNNINLWGNIAVLKGGNKYRDTRVVLGLKYFFKYD